MQTAARFGKHIYIHIKYRPVEFELFFLNASEAPRFQVIGMAER